MDTKIEKKTSRLKVYFLAAGSAVLAGLFFIYFSRQKKTYNVPLDDIEIAKVTRGRFEDAVLLTATAQSLHSSLVNVIEGGAVKEIYAEDGQMVAKGQPLARVFNPTTEFNYLNQETGIMQQISQMRNSLLELKNQEFSQNKELLQAQNDYNVALQAFVLQKRLYEAEIGRKTDYSIADQNLKYQQQRKQLTEQGVVNEKKSRNQQIAAVAGSIVQMQRSLEVLKNNRNNFLILSPAAGRLSSFTLSPGQNLAGGESIGKVNLMEGYKLVAKIDEYYAGKLMTGVRGTLESNGETYGVIVTKVLPEVKDGQFSAEIGFTDGEPANLKMGMTFGVKLKLSEDRESLVIPKGNFYKDTSGRWLFVVRGKTAEKRNVMLGKENQLYYEVLKGLSEGESIVISDYGELKNFDVLNIKGH